MNQIKNSFREVKRSAQTNLNNLKFDTKSVDNYKKNLNQLNDAYKMQKDNVNGLKRELDKLEDAGKGNSQEAQNLRNEYNKQVDEMNKLGRAVEQTTAELKELEEQQRISNSRWNKTGEALQANGEKFQKVGGGMQKVGGIFTAASAAIVGGAVGAGAGLLALTNKATETADGIAKGAEKIGTSTDFYQEMDFWASQNGLSQENMEKAVGRLNQRLGLAVEGNEKYANALERLGVDLQGVEDGTITTEDAMATSIQTLSEMENESEKAALASELFGTKMSRDLMPALNDGSLSIEEAKEKAQELGLVMSEDQMNAAEEFQDAQDQIKRSMGAVAMQIGLDLMPHFQKMLDWIRDNMPMIREKIMNAFNGAVESVKSVINWWNDLSGTMQKIIPIIAGLALAFGPILLVVGKVISVIGGLMTVLGPVMTSIAKAGGLLKWLTPLFGALTSPVTLTIAAIAALGAGFVIAYNKSETFRNFITGLKDRFLDAWESVLTFKDNFITAFKGIFALFKGDDGGIDLLKSLGLNENQISMITGAVNRIKETFEIMKENVVNALSGISQFFIKQFNGIKVWWDSDGEMILSAIGTFFENMMRGIRRVAKFGLNFVIGLFETFAPIVKGIWNALWPTILFLVETVWEKIKLTIGIAMDLIKGIISAVSAIIEGDWSRFGEVLKSTALSIKDRVTEFFGNMKDNALKLFGKLFSGAKRWFSDMWTNVTNKARDIKTGVVNRFNELKDGAINKVRAAYNSVTSWFQNMWSNVTTKARNIKNDVVKRFNELKNNSIQKIRDTYNSITKWFSDMWSKVTTTVTNLKNDVVNYFVDMKDGAIEGVQKLYNGASGLFDDVKTYASDTFQNMVDGAKELPGKLGDAIKNGASKAVDGIKSLGNKMTEKLGAVVNGVIGGLNSVTAKIGIDTKIKEWKVPTFSTGTGQGSPSGKLTKNGKIAMDTLATVGDKGKGNGKGTRELVHYPNGKVGLYDNDATIFAPKGTTIFSNKETESMIDMLPKFSEGTGLWGKIKNIASKAVDYITNPKKIFDDLISAVGENFGDMSGFALNMVKGAWNTIKDGMFGWIKDKFSESSVGKKQKWMDYKMTTPYSPNKPVPGYPTSFNGGRHYGIDYATPVGVNITAPFAGKVKKQSDVGGGNVARLQGGNASQYFLHMNSVKTGSVGVGDSVGKSGNTGEYTTGPHVHWQHEEPKTRFLQNKNTKNPLKMIKGHLKGGKILTDGLFNLHGGEYVINPNEPTEAMKLIALAGKELAGKSKQTKELPNPTGGNKNHEEMMMKMQQQIDLLTQLVTSNKAIENKDYQPEININDLNKKQNRFNDDRTILI